MTTTGIYAFVYRGRFYLFFNSSDSYPEGLGVTVVNNIPLNPSDYRGEEQYVPILLHSSQQLSFLESLVAELT